MAERHQRTITINDVAKAAGVSKATVSVALSAGTTTGATIRVAPETRLRIRRTAEELGYAKSGLAHALSVGRTYTVGLVSQVDSLSENIHSFNAYQKDVMIAVTCACARAGLRMTTILVSTPGKTSANEIADGRVDGAVLATLRDDALGEEVFKRGLPAVTIGSGYAERRVWPDNRGGMRQAVEHLYALGHRRILYVGISVPGMGTWTTNERTGGYTDAMTTHGLIPRILTVPDLNAAFAESPFKPPTACICFNDMVAVRVMRWGRRRGMTVPQDFSLIGFDDGVTAQSTDPCLTTIENPIDAQATAAISLLQSLWRNELALSPPPIPTNLIVRESTTVAPVTSKEF